MRLSQLVTSAAAMALVSIPGQAHAQQVPAGTTEGAAEASDQLAKATTAGVAAAAAETATDDVCGDDDTLAVVAAPAGAATNVVQTTIGKVVVADDVLGTARTVTWNARTDLDFTKVVVQMGTRALVATTDNQGSLTVPGAGQATTVTFCVTSEVEVAGVVEENPDAEEPAAQPPVAQPPVAQPPVAEPPAAQPPVAQPPVAQPPVAQPPVAQPPVAQPPVAQPPAAQPPVAQPPAAQPPVAQPPVAQPPAAQPPVEEAPATTPESDDDATPNPTGGQIVGQEPPPALEPEARPEPLDGPDPEPDTEPDTEPDAEDEPSPAPTENVALVVPPQDDPGEQEESPDFDAYVTGLLAWVPDSREDEDDSEESPDDDARNSLPEDLEIEEAPLPRFLEVDLDEDEDALVNAAEAVEDEPLPRFLSVGAELAGDATPVAAPAAEAVPTTSPVLAADAEPEVLLLTIGEPDLDEAVQLEPKQPRQRRLPSVGTELARFAMFGQVTFGGSAGQIRPGDVSFA